MDRKARTAPIVRSRVTLAEGVFVVFEAPTDEAGHATGDGYLAYWRFPESDEVLVYAQVLLSRMDVGEAMIALQRQFGLDVLLIAEASPRLGRALAEAVDRGVEPSAEWVSATRANVNVIVGLESAKSSSETGPDRSGPIVAVACEPCYSGIVLVEEAVQGEAAGRMTPWRAVAAIVPSEEPLEGGVVTEPLEEGVVTEPFPVGGDGGDAFEDGIMAACCCNWPKCPNCGDGDPCTVDSCVRTCYWASCEHREFSCSDGNPCTDDVCGNGTCTYPGISGGPCADDGNPCTSDVCNSIGSCTHPRISGPQCADDGNPCTDDVCWNGACTHPANDSLACVDDGNPCTDDVCSDGACTHPPISGPQCDDDGDPCTDNVCVEGSCTHPPISGPECVDDGYKCTDDVCVEGACTHPDKDCGPPETTCGVKECHPCAGCVERNCCYGGDPCSSVVCEGSGNCCTANGLCNWTCELAPVEPYNSCSPLGCTLGLTMDDVPDVVPLNDDDDNENGVPDYLEWGAVSGENDRYYVGVYVDPSCAPLPGPFCGVDVSEYAVVLGSWWGLGFYATPSGGSEVDDCLPWPGPTGVWVEGLAATGRCGVHTSVGINCHIATCPRFVSACYKQHSRSIVVAKVAKLEWQLYALSNDQHNCTLADNEALDRCPNNGGVRIFPDKTSPGETDADAEVHRVIDLVATIEPPVKGVKVHFRGYDVDDPFDQVHGPAGLNDVANASLVDPSGAIAGDDNRGSGGIGTRSAVTDAYGRARTSMTVSMQPGDNYRAAATLHGSTVLGSARVEGMASALSVRTSWNGKLLSNGDFSGYVCPVTWSQMLTVWRKLHVERDTMAPPQPTDFRVVSQINAVYATPGRPGTTTVEIACPGGTANPDTNNYEGGQITFANCPIGSDVFGILENYPCNAILPYKLIVLGTPGACAAVGTPCSFYDDDDLDALGTATAPRFPDGGILLKTAFQPAYILPQYAVDFQNIVPFESYLDYWEILTGAGSWNDSRSLESSSNYWASFILGAWEGGDAQGEITTDGDGDPDGCPITPGPIALGAESPLTGVRRVGTIECIAFLEAIADEISCINLTDEAHTVVHEIGHTCGSLPHKSSTLMEVGAPKSQNTFDADQLRIIREQDPW